MLDTESKFEWVADQMHLEPAEEIRPSVAPCGFSPDELHKAVASGAMNTITKGNGNPGQSLAAKKNSLGLYDAAIPGGKRVVAIRIRKTNWSQ